MRTLTKEGQSRRAVIGGGAAFLGATLVGCAGRGPTAGAGVGGATSAQAGAAEPTTLTPADFEALGACELQPAQTEGPFYTDVDRERRDITEGRPGQPMRLGLRVVDEDCAPVPGAIVDIWQCDAGGDYSAFIDGSSPGEAGPGTTFLRGHQVANQDGIVEFHTIYPGWYPGRTVHIHFKVHVEGTTYLTSQLYLPDEVTDRVYAQAPYNTRGQRFTRNNNDWIAGNPERDNTLIATTDGTLGLVVLGVRSSSNCTFWEWLWSLLTGQGGRCS